MSTGTSMLTQRSGVQVQSTFSLPLAKNAQKFPEIFLYFKIFYSVAEKIDYINSVLVIMPFRNVLQELKFQAPFFDKLFWLVSSLHRTVCKNLLKL